MKIIWKKHKDPTSIGYNYTIGWIKGIDLFQYSYNCIDKKYRDTPYLLRVYIGRPDHFLRYRTEKECKLNALRILKSIKGDLE